MSKVFSRFGQLLFALALLMLPAAHAYGETAKQDEGGARFYIGMVKSIDCKSGEIKVSGRQGENAFHVGKETKYEDVKGCGDIAAGGIIRVWYSAADQKNMALRLKYRAQNPEAEKARAEKKGQIAAAGRKSNIFMGFVNAMDCGTGLITVEQMDNRTMKESIHITKETIFETGSPANACKDIIKESLVSVIYLEQEGKKVATKVKLMLKDTK